MTLCLRLVLLLSLLLGASPRLGAAELVEQWRYVVQPPQGDWQSPDFDDSSWRQGKGGFGSHGTPGARIKTRWSSPDIWARKVVALDEPIANPALWIHHDDAAEVYINGRLAARLEGWTNNYQVVKLDARLKAALKPGENTLAVHCHQDQGGQFIDVHVIDADHVPELPRETRPFLTELITEWGAQVSPENAWREYPRPQMERPEWTCLNGQWDYAVTPRSQRTRPAKWEGEILVPFCLESKLGGVQRLLDPSESLWYRRTFSAKKSAGKRVHLNFEAVDYACQVWVNGTAVGDHKGGCTPFSLDVTDALRDGDNELVVLVDDDTQEWQLNGKQRLLPEGIWYTRVSGIWQTVWLEETPTAYVRELKITTDPQTGSISVRPIVGGDAAGLTFSIALAESNLVATAEGVGTATAVVPQAKLWSPDSPHLYEFEARLTDAAGKTVDRVNSYAGIRSVGKVRDADGHWRLALNGQPIFHWGPLDQGWWPDGLLTPPSDEAMAFDVKFLKAAGFNMIRKHIKVEPRRYYALCDRLGIMLWQDQVSGGGSPPWTHLEPNPTDADWSDARHEQFMLEFERMVDSLENHPSIVMWQPYNEAWGQHRSLDTGRWIVKRDPTRLVNIASGGNFWPVGDVADLHSYPNPNFPLQDPRFNDYVKVVGEFGGHGYAVKGHLWDADRGNWGYGGLPRDKAEYERRYVESLDRLNDLRLQGVSAGVYTQTTDVEAEINGLMTYDRKVVKIPAAKLAELHQRLFAD